jgi:uncharacterized protein
VRVSNDLHDNERHRSLRPSSFQHLAHSIRAIAIACIASALAVGAPAQKLAENLRIPGLPTTSSWRHQPLSASYENGTLTIIAGQGSNWFITPIDGTEELSADSAPTLLFPIESKEFVFSARISLDFDSQWDAGALVVFANDKTWAKFCFEKNISGKPMVVSVITRGRSDDNNHFFVEGHSIWFKVAKLSNGFIFYTSFDGKSWTIIRDFNLNEGVDYKPGDLRFGFLAQSPEGKSTKVVFDNIVFQPSRIANAWTGQ